MKKTGTFLEHFFWLNQKKLLPPNLLLEGEESLLKQHQAFFIKTIICAQNGKCSPPCTFCQQPTYDDSLFLEIKPVASTIKGEALTPLFAWSQQLAPNQQTKIYWISEIEKMTLLAFNKILKFLEEAPSYCFGILTTNNPQLLPATIKSRLPHFVFNLDHQLQESTINSALSSEDQKVLFNLDLNFHKLDQTFLQTTYFPAKTLLQTFFHLLQTDSLERFYFHLEKLDFAFDFFLELLIIHLKLALLDPLFATLFQTLEQKLADLEKLILFSCQLIYQNQLFYHRTKNKLNPKTVAFNWFSQVLENFIV